MGPLDRVQLISVLQILKFTPEGTPSVVPEALVTDNQRRSVEPCIALFQSSLTAASGDSEYSSPPITTPEHDEEFWDRAIPLPGDEAHRRHGSTAKCCAPPSGFQSGKGSREMNSDLRDGFTFCWIEALDDGCEYSRPKGKAVQRLM